MKHQVTNCNPVLGHERKNIFLIPLSEEREVFLRHYESIAEMRPMLKSVRYFRKFAIGIVGIILSAKELRQT